MSDKERVLEGRPWSFDRQILVLYDFDGSIPPAQMHFTYSPLWIQVHDMPLICMNKAVGTKIGESMGALEDVDVAGDGSGWGRCLRLRVTLDLFNPLERGRALSLGGKNYWVTFKYERLPSFCFNCGRILHGVKGCPVKGSQRRHDDGPKDWGVWLRAVDSRRRVGGDRGGDFFKGEGNPADGASWRKDSAQNGNSVHGGNPRRDSCFGNGSSSCGGDSFLLKDRCAVGKERKDFAEGLQLDRLSGESEGSYVGNKKEDTNQEGHVEQAVVSPERLFRGTMQEEHDIKSQMGSRVIAEKNLTIRNAQDTEQKHETAVDKLLTHELVGEAEDWMAMATNEMDKDIIERPRWSVRRWKRQARGDDHNGTQSQQMGRNKKKRKNSLEKMASEGEQRKKCKRGGVGGTDGDNGLAAAVQQPRQVQ
jgi:hypothetical protein